VPKPVRYEAKDGSTSWRVRFRVGTAGTTETFATKKDADRFCKMVEAMGGARARAVMNETEATAVTDILLRDVATKWLEWKGATRPDGTPLRHSSTYTTDRYGQLVRNQILPHLGKRPINLISHRDVQEWVDLTLSFTASTSGPAPKRKASPSPTPAPKPCYPSARRTSPRDSAPPSGASSTRPR
jgi:hypothetical protein